MPIVRLGNGSLKLAGLAAAFGAMRLRTRLFLALIPSVVAILAITGYITHWSANRFLHEALERNVATQTLAMAYQLEIFLNQCREDLLVMAQGPVSQMDLLRFVEARKATRGYVYKEVAYVSTKSKENVFLVDIGQGAIAVRSSDVARVRPSPLGLLDHLGEMTRDAVWISDIFYVTYPPSADGTVSQSVTAQVIRFATPYLAGGASPKGILMVGVELRQMREIMSLFNSPRSPLFAFVRSPEPRYSFLFDRDGWILFQSEGPEDQSRELSVELARTAMSGTFGRPGLDSAFRPHGDHAWYWEMVRDVNEGRNGVMRLPEPSAGIAAAQGYAPVRFTKNPNGSPSVLFGISFVDRSRLPLWAGYRQIEVMFVITLLAIVVISVVIFGMSEALSRPILRMAGRVREMAEAGTLQEMDLEARDYETRTLKAALNHIIRVLRGQMAKIRERDEQLELERQRERVRLEEEIKALKSHATTPYLDEILGVGPMIESLKAEILKAASVDADVLIIGETGTGKQLTAEAIHRHSKRGKAPFVSINCRALDDNLLLDSLFGHVKGAFTEAKEDRKGAFVTADGGTLFLDEISTASPKVQQALLRAVSMRKIRPLGSDQELDVDVRVIAASNVELKELIERGAFREDLYYRLEVITIRTPPLRQHKESIPLLVDYFLRQACRLTNKEGLGLSPGALEKLIAYDWPGNVRELMNCVARAVAMTEGPLIHSEDLRLGDEEAKKTGAIPLLRPAAVREPFPVPLDLNPRQRKAWPVIQSQGRITRSEYQEIHDGKLPARTALYDLQEMVSRGLLRKIGKGPATQYEVIYPATAKNPA